MLNLRALHRSRLCSLAPLALLLLPAVIAAEPAAAQARPPSQDWVLKSASWGAGPMLISLRQSARAEAPLAGTTPRLPSRAVVWTDLLTKQPPMPNRAVEVAAHDLLAPALQRVSQTQ
jgi:hypothetical protein